MADGSKIRGFSVFRPRPRLMLRSAFGLVLLTCLVVSAAIAASIVGKAMLDRARLSDAVYEVGKTPAGWKFLEGGEKDSGFKWGVYERTLDDGSKERVLAIAGTDLGFGSKREVVDTTRDFWTDATQALKDPDGLPPTQYTEALTETLRQMQQAQKDGVPLSITGHSLGGGLAQYASLMTGTPATVFNSAPLGPSTRAQLPRDVDDSLITNVRTEGDLVSEGAQHVRNGKQYGEQVVIKPQPGTPGILPDDQRSLSGYLHAHLPEQPEGDQPVDDSPSLLDFNNWLKHQGDRLHRLGNQAKQQVQPLKVMAQYVKDKANDWLARHSMTNLADSIEAQLGTTPQPHGNSGNPGQSPTVSTSNASGSTSTGQPQQASKPEGEQAGGSKYNGPSIEELNKKGLLIP